MFWPEPAIVYDCRWASYETEPGCLTLPTSVWVSNAPRFDCAPMLPVRVRLMAIVRNDAGFLRLSRQAIASMVRRTDRTTWRRALGADGARGVRRNRP